jgi:hypothetical protein
VKPKIFLFQTSGDFCWKINFNMKLRVISLILVLIFAACSSRFGVVKTTHDDYKNNKTIQLSLRYRAEERRSEASSVEMTFVRLVQPSIGEELGVYVKISKSASAFEIEEEGFVKVDGQKFAIQFQNRRENVLSETTPVVENQTIQDTTGSRTIQVVTGMNTSTWKEEHFYWPVSPELAEAIKRCQTLEFRYYIGPNPVTLSTNPMDLEKIKQWLNS